MKKYVIKTVAAILIILLIPVFALLLGYRTTAFDQNFYSSEFKKNNVYGRFNMSEQDVDALNAELLGYLKAEKSNAQIQSSMFSEREKLHLIDVKNFMQLFMIMLYASIIAIGLLLAMLAILCMKIKPFLYYAGKAFMFGGIFTYVLALIAYLGTLDFSSSFTRFHTLLFSNDFWILSSDSTLIRLFPEQFFYDITQVIIIKALAYANFFLIIGLVLYFGYRHMREKDKGKKEGE